MQRKIKKTGKDGLYQMISDKLDGAITSQVVSNYTSQYGWKAETKKDVDTWIASYKAKTGNIDDEEIKKAKALSIVSKSKTDEQKAIQSLEDSKRKEFETIRAEADAKKAVLQAKILEGGIIEVAEMELCFSALAELLKTTFTNLTGELPNDLFGQTKKEIQETLTEHFDSAQKNLAEKTAQFINDKNK